ncbi:MAG: glycerol-3-phosphate acyltransferase [Chloroflexota bacterium]|nr:glycerol-3-phosphate acyltransferase [Chloroflexota bacterium]
MSSELALIQSVIASIVVGYLLGSIPLAHLVARRRGIDIFATGSTRAGTANVFWNISRRNGIMVFAGDAAKGFLAIKFAILFGVPDQALIVAGLAAVAGHWKSVFTRFRGGDGMVTLLGVTVALTPVLSLLGIVVGIVAVLLTRRSPFRSSIGIAACFIVLLGVSHTVGQFENHQLFVKELSVLALLVIFHNVLIHRIRAPALAESAIDPDSDDDLDDFPDAGLEPDFSEKT